MTTSIVDYHHIVITGASSGIGAALAHRYARQGVHLSLSGRNKDRLERVAGLCREAGTSVDTAVIDVVDQAAMDEWLRGVDQALAVDLVIANAGISGGTGEQGIESDAQLRALFDVNVRGVFNTIEPLKARMIERGEGHIAIMASLAGFRGFPGAPGYCASKAAVRVYGEGLRGALYKSGVKVSVICPGFVRSPMTDVNDYAMPFLMSVDRAANIIAKGIAKGKGRIAFPIVTYFLAWLAGTLPDFVSHYLLKNAPQKPSLTEGE